MISMICLTKSEKKPFSFNLQKSNQNSQYKGKFDIDLFKLIRDNFSNNYPLALEFYFKKRVVSGLCKRICIYDYHI